MINILYIEDDSAHIELTSRSLENSEPPFNLQTAPTINHAFSLIQTNEYDVILSDYRLPDGSGLDVIRMAQEKKISTAIVLITNLENIDVAIAALKAGAVDYIVKQSDYLLKLPIVLSNAYKHTQVEKQKKALYEIENRYRSIFENAVEGIFQSSIGGRFINVNPAMAQIYGYESPDDMVNSVTSIKSQIYMGEKKRNEFLEALNSQGVVTNFESQNLRKDGSIIWTSTNARAVKDEFGNTLYVEGFLKDISARKEAERLLERQLKELTILREATLAGTQSATEDEIIEKVTQITASIYSDVCGVLLLNDDGNILTPHTSYMGANISSWRDGYPITDGITGRAVRTGSLIRIDDISKDANYIEIASETKSEVCVPFQVQEKIIGVLNVESRYVNAFDEDDERLLNTIAGGLGTAIEKLRLFEAEQTQRQRETAILNLIRVAASSLDLNQVLQSILDQLTKVIPSDGGSIQLLDGDRLKIVAAIGKDEIKLMKSGSLLLDEFPINNHIVTKMKTIRVDNVLMNDSYKIFDEDINIRSFLGIPLIANKKTIGMIALNSQQVFHFTRQDEELGLALANHASIAMENARLFQEESRRSQIIEALANIANEIATTREVMPALDKIAERTLSLLNANTTAVYLLQDDQKTVKIVTAKGDYQKELLSHTLEVGEGITGDIISSGKAEIVDNVAKDPRKKTVPGTSEDDSKLDTMMSAPLILHGKSIGAINAWKLRTNGLFDKSELNFLMSIAHQASISIESMRLFEESTRRTQEAAAIAEVGRGISATLQLDNVLESIASYARNLLKAETSAVYLFEPHSSLLRAISAIGIDSEEIKNDPLQLGVGILGDIAMKKFGEIVNNSALDPRTVVVKGTEIMPDEHIMSVPVLSNEQLTGLLVVWRVGAEQKYKTTDLDFLSSLAQQAAVAIENARLFEAEHKRRQEAEILNQATSAIANTLDINNLFKNILNWLEKIVPYDSASIMMIHQGTLRLAAKRNLPKQFFIGQIFEMTKKWKDIISVRKPYLIENAQASDNFEKWEGVEYVRGWMGIAMFIQDKPIGFINLDSKTIGAYTEEHAILAQTFANQAATAIENARLFELEQKRRKEAEIVRQAATILSSLLDLPSLHEAILEWLRKIIPYDSATILEIDGDHIHITAAKGIPNLEQAKGQMFPSDNILCQIINETGEPLIIDDCENDLRFERWGGVENIRGWMGAPLITRGQVIGYINIDSHKPNAFTKNDAIAVQTFAHQAANSLENSRLYTETLQRLEELEIVSRVSYTLRAAQDTEEMFPILLNEIKTNMGTDSAAIWLYDEGKNELTPMATSGLMRSLPKSTFQPNEGIVGTVYSGGTMRISPSLTHDPLITQKNSKFFEAGWSGIALPIRTVSETIGVLVVTMPESYKIGANHIRLITTLTEIAGNAIYRSHLFDRSEEQIRRLTILREVDTAITSSLDLNITLGILTEHLLTKMNVSAATVLVFNADSQSLIYHAPTGFKNRENIYTPQNIGDGLAGQVFSSRRAIYKSDLIQEPDLLQVKPLKSEQFISYYGIPLFSKGVTKGVLETYFRQPFSPNPDWLDFLHTLAEQAVIAIDNAELFENLQRSNQDLSIAYDTTLEGWGKALELRDRETKGHTNRVTSLTLELARELSIPESELVHIRRGALLHDIGKMGVPDKILHKNGPLTKNERLEMCKHPKYARDLLYPITYLRPAIDIAYCHHEWWDGSGYPRGLKAEEIPLSARIFAVVDVWDALLSNRPYRNAWSAKKTLKYIKGLSHKQFDPYIVDVFCKMIENNNEYMKASPPKKSTKPIPKKAYKSKQSKNKKK